MNKLFQLNKIHFIRPMNGVDHNAPCWWNNRLNVIETKQADVKARKARAKLSASFNEFFPDVDFDNLIKQNDKVSTDDGCIHYIHKNGKDVYSYEYDENTWTLADVEDTKYLIGNEFFDIPKMQNSTTAPIWWDDKVKIMKQQQQKQKEIDIQKLFDQTYPNVKFDSLIPQNNNIRTNDGCDHYLHKQSGTIYSYDCIKNNWKISHNTQGLINLFNSN